MSSRTNRRPGKALTAALAGAQVVLLAGGAFGAARIGGQSHRLPTFAVGGAFLRDGRPAGTPDPVSRGLTASAAAPAYTSTSSAAPGPSVSADSAVASPARAAATASPVGRPHVSNASGPILPAAGTYTYSISGQESSTGFGARSFPSTMSIDVHRGSGLPANQVVLDITFSSQHQEREILQYDQRGISMVYEAGAVTFGPMTQTNQATYVPAMVQMPLPDEAGALASGTSAARNSDGSTDRIEDWTTSVQGIEAVQTQSGYRQCPVIRIERRTRPGSADQETRRVSYRYDPGLGIWDRWTVLMHAQRSYVGFTFTYDENFTATLSEFQPG